MKFSLPLWLRIRNQSWKVW